MCSYLQKHKILHRSQSRFRPGHTPKMYNYVASVDDWRRGLDNNHLVGVVLVDLSKAFDSVNHDLLLCKMDRYGIRGKEQCWFHTYLSGRKQRVVIDVNSLLGELWKWGFHRDQFSANSFSHCL